MPTRRITALALAADAVAVVVFAAAGRVSHAAPGEAVALLGTVAPFAVGLVASWVTPVVRAHPTGLRAGAVVLAGTAVIGLLLRAGFTGRLPVGFAVVTVVTLGLLLLGWRGLATIVSHRASQRVR